MDDSHRMHLSHTQIPVLAYANHMNACVCVVLGSSEEGGREVQTASFEKRKTRMNVEAKQLCQNFLLTISDRDP